MMAAAMDMRIQRAWRVLRPTCERRLRVCTRISYVGDEHPEEEGEDSADALAGGEVADHGDGHDGGEGHASALVAAAAEAGDGAPDMEEHDAGDARAHLRRDGDQDAADALRDSGGADDVLVHGAGFHAVDDGEDAADVVRGVERVGHGRVVGVDVRPEIVEDGDEAVPVEQHGEAEEEVEEAEEGLLFRRVDLERRALFLLIFQVGLGQRGFSDGGEGVVFSACVLIHGGRCDQKKIALFSMAARRK